MARSNLASSEVEPNLRFQVIGSSTTVELQPIFDWWSAQTLREPHMLNESPEDLIKSLLVGVVAYDDNQIVGVAGIFPARTGSGEELVHDGRRIVEMGSSVVSPDHRQHGIGSHLVEQRAKIAQANGWVAVSVTTNCVAQHLLEKFGAQPMEAAPEYAEIRQALCLCPKANSACLVCPLHHRAAWYFPLLGGS